MNNIDLNKLTVRESIEEDLPLIYNLSKNSFTNSWSLDSYKNDFKNVFSKYISLIYNGELIGFLTSIIIVEEVTITNIAINENFRGNGLSKYLLKYLIALYIHYEFFLEVRQSNIVAINLYKSFGFEEIYIRENYYTNPKENAIIMKKILGQIKS